MQMYIINMNIHQMCFILNKTIVAYPNTAYNKFESDYIVDYIGGMQLHLYKDSKLMAQNSSSNC